MRALFFICATLLAQQDVIRTTTNEVIVDVVVRDKKGKLVSGLGSGDFTILEDGVPQTVTSIREIKGSLSGGAEAKAGGGNGPADATRPVKLMSLVFDRLGIDSRRLARQAANDLLKAELSTDVYIAVFASDLHLKVIQPFTNDRAKLKAAIERVAGGSAMTNYADVNSSLKAAINSSQGSEGAAAAAAGGPGNTSVDGGGMAQESMNRMVADMLEFAETSLQEQQGRSSIYALWGVVKEQTRLPGRKTVLFFSEGLQVPTSVLGNFRSMISSANRANVSVYAIDARGLSTAEDSAAAAAALNASLAVSQRQYKSTESASAVTRVEANQFDRAMDSIRANPQVNLAELAEGTGGVLIANMNDFRKPIQRLVEDLGSYYEIIYRSQNTSLDGSFRTITTKLNRSDVTIQSRNGYFALPTLKGANVLPFEVPLLKALSSAPLPKGLEFRASVWRGRPTAESFESTIIFEMPMKDMTFRALDPEPSYRAHVSFLALVKDAEGQVVGKISNDLPVNLPKEKLEGFRSGSVFFTRQLSLRPGRYTIESSAADLEATKVAARKTALVIPVPDATKLGLSSITLVRRLEDAQGEDPFVMGTKRAVPTLVDRVPVGGKNALSFFFTLYPLAGGEKTDAIVEFFLEDKLVGGGKVELPAVQPDGRIPYIATIPLASFQPGLYEVKVRALQGQQAVQQSIFVTME